MMRKKIKQLKPGLLPSQDGLRCEILFNAAQPGYLTVGGSWSLGTATRLGQRKYGVTLGNGAQASYCNLPKQIQALQTNQFTIIGAIRKSGSSTIWLACQRNGGQGFYVSASGMEVLQWNVKNNSAVGVGGAGFLSAIAGNCVVAATRNANKITYYLNGNVYGSATGSTTLSSTAGNAAIGAQASSGAFSGVAAMATRDAIYGVAVLPTADDALVQRIISVEDFFSVFFIEPKPTTRP